MRVSLGGPSAGRGGGGGGPPAPPRVACTILVNGDGTLTVQAGAVGVVPGGTAAVVVADPTGGAPNAVQLTFETPFATADYAFEGNVAGHSSVFANGQLFEVPPAGPGRSTASILFYAETPNGFLDMATGLVNAGNFGLPVTLNVFCG